MERNERHYVLTVDHPHPTRNAVTARVSGTQESVKKRAAGALRRLGERWGVAPIALSWELEVVA